MIDPEVRSSGKAPATASLISRLDSRSLPSGFSSTSIIRSVVASWSAAAARASSETSYSESRRRQTVSTLRASSSSSLESEPARFLTTASGSGWETI